MDEQLQKIADELTDIAQVLRDIRDLMFKDRAEDSGE